jgi:hypothetical protein
MACDGRFNYTFPVSDGILKMQRGQKGKSAAAPRALPFVSEKDGRLEVSKDVVEFFQGLAAPFSVVCVAGQYRTGKSFLLNRGVLNLPPGRDGFPTGSTIQAVTRGLWVYPEVIERDGARLVVLDSEGTRSLTASADADSKLIALALLLSSVFIYNSTGNVDQSTVSALGVFASVARVVSCAEGGDDEERSASSCKPELLWVCRDFHLDLLSESGSPMTPAQYLESVLAGSEGTHADDDLNTVIAEQFPSRSLVPLIRPVEKESDLVNLSKLPDKSFRPEFLSQLEAFRALLTQRAPVKSLRGVALAGPVFLEIAQHLCERINSGCAPNVRDTFDFMIENELLRFEGTFTKQLAEHCEGIAGELPMPPESLEAIRQQWAVAKGGAPPALRGAASSARWAQIRQTVVSEILEKLEAKNEELATKWTRQELQACQKVEMPLAWFREHVERSISKVGGAKCLSTLSLFLEVACDRAEGTAKSNAAELDARGEALAALTAKLKGVEAEREDLRAQYEEVLMRNVGAPSDTVPKEEHAALEQRLTEQDARLAELTARAEDDERERERCFGESGAADPSKEDGPGRESLGDCVKKIHELTFTLDEKYFELASATELLDQMKADRAAEVDRLVGDMQRASVSVEEEHARALGEQSARAASALKDADNLKAKLEEAVQETKKAAEAAKDARKEMLKMEDDCQASLRKQRDEGTRTLTEKVNLMSANFSETRKELTQTRGRALEAERARSTSDGHAQNYKRKAEGYEREIEDMKRVKVEMDETRVKNMELKATNTALASINGEIQTRCRAAEQSLRELEQEAASSARQHCVEVARLEILLAARGGQLVQAPPPSART